MAGTVGLHQLVGAVAGAIVDAQGLVEQHYVEQVRRYFAPDGRPHCLHVKLPRASSTNEDYLDVAVPMLSLAESHMLGIRDLKVELEVELGDILDAPIALPPIADGPNASGQPASPDPSGPAPASAPFAAVGAPIGLPVASSDDIAPPSTSGGDAPLPPLAAPAAPAMRAPLPAKVLTLSVGSRSDSAPRARLSINVASRPQSEGMLRLLTQLNKLV